MTDTALNRYSHWPCAWLLRLGGFVILGRASSSVLWGQGLRRLGQTCRGRISAVPKPSSRCLSTGACWGGSVRCRVEQKRRRELHKWVFAYRFAPREKSRLHPTAASPSWPARTISLNVHRLRPCPTARPWRHMETRRNRLHCSKSQELVPPVGFHAVLCTLLL